MDYQEVVKTGLVAEMFNPFESPTKNGERISTKLDVSRKKNSPRFHRAWLHVPEFELWLTRAKDDAHAHCIYCKKDIIALIQELQKHSGNQSHIKNVQSYYSSLIAIKEEKNLIINEDDPFDTLAYNLDGEMQNVDIESYKEIQSIELDSQQKKKTKVYKQRFRKAWLDMPVFKDWLREGSLPAKGYCICCECSVIAGKSELLKHSLGKKHLRNFQTFISKKNATETQESLAQLSDDTFEKNLLDIIDLRSDSLSHPPLDLKNDMVSYDKERDYMAELEERSTKLAGKDAAILLSSHSAANFVAVLSHCQTRGSTVIAGNDSDIIWSLKESIVKMGGLCCFGIDNEIDGSFSPRESEELLLRVDLQPPSSAVICYECPHWKKGGVIPPLDWIDELSYLSTSTGVGLHCDGTRLLNAALHYRCSSSRLVYACHSVTLGLDKGLCAPIGALLIGEKNLIARADKIANYIGVNMSRKPMIARGCLHALKNMLYKLSLDHDNARGVAEVLAPLKSINIQVELGQVQTNVIHLNTFNGLTASQLAQRLASITEREGIESSEKPPVILARIVDDNAVALSMRSGISPIDINRIKNKLRYIIQELQEP